MSFNMMTTQTFAFGGQLMNQKKQSEMVLSGRFRTLGAPPGDIKDLHTSPWKKMKTMVTAESMTKECLLSEQLAIHFEIKTKKV